MTLYLDHYLLYIYFRGVSDNAKSKIMLNSSAALCAVVEKRG